MIVDVMYPNPVISLRTFPPPMNWALRVPKYHMKMTEITSRAIFFPNLNLK